MQTKRYWLHPTTFELPAQWLHNGCFESGGTLVDNEPMWYFANMCSALYAGRWALGVACEPRSFALTPAAAGILLGEIEGRLEAVDDMLHGMPVEDIDHDRLLDERRRLLADHQSILSVEVDV